MKEFQEIYNKAAAAGLEAGNKIVPRAMIVGHPPKDNPLSSEVDYSQKTWYEPEGVCGFAWVHIAGTTPFARWAKKAGLASKDYPKGLMFWVREFGQSMQRKEEYARAFARVLNEAGIEAYACSRLD